VTPARSANLDLGVRVMTASSPRHDFQNRLESILACLYSDFIVDRQADYFTFRHGMRIYAALHLMAHDCAQGFLSFGVTPDSSGGG
jgi:hypothetical protein